jgi:hypothetical protein
MSVSEIELARPLTNGSGERVESNVVAIDRAGHTRPLPSTRQKVGIAEVLISDIFFFGPCLEPKSSLAY